MKRPTAGRVGTGGRRVRASGLPARAIGGAAFVAAALFVGAAPVEAQPGGAERAERLTQIFSEMERDTGVRVTTPLLFIDRGSFVGLGADEVRIEFAGEVVPVALTDIRTVQVEGRHPVQGMLWGIGVGGLVGTVSGMLVASYYCTSPVACAREERRGAILGGTVLALAGGIGGFVIGRYNVSWRPIFP